MLMTLGVKMSLKAQYMSDFTIIALKHIYRSQDKTDDRFISQSKKELLSTFGNVTQRDQLQGLCPLIASSLLFQSEYYRSKG